MVGLLAAPGVRYLVVQSVFHQHRPRRDHRHEQIAIHRQAILAAGEEAQPRDKPRRKLPRCRLDPFAGIALAGKSPGQYAAHARTSRNQRGDAFIDGRGDRGHLAVARISEHADVLHIHLRQRFQVVQHHSRGPGPSGQRSEVILGIECRQRRGIIHAVVAGISAGDISAPQQRRSPARQVRADQNGKGPLALGDHHLHPNGRLALRAEFQAHVANQVSFAGRFVKHHRAIELRFWRERARVVLLQELPDLGAPRLPFRGRPNRPSIEKLQRIGQSVDFREGIEVRRYFAGLFEPLAERRNIRQGL